MALNDDIVRSVSAALERCREAIRATMAAEGVDASGRTSDSLRVVQRTDGFDLVGGGEGAAPIPTLEVGRGGGAVPVGFYYIIKQWTRDKGLQFGSETQRGTFAYFAAQKIAREGTQRHKSPKDIYSTHARNTAEEIRGMVVEQIGQAVLGEVVHAFNNN